MPYKHIGVSVVSLETIQPVLEAANPSRRLSSFFMRSFTIHISVDQSIVQRPHRSTRLLLTCILNETHFLLIVYVIHSRISGHQYRCLNQIRIKHSPEPVKQPTCLTNSFKSIPMTHSRMPKPKEESEVKRCVTIGDDNG